MRVRGYKYCYVSSNYACSFITLHFANLDQLRCSYISDIRSGISSNLRLFADDGILYQVVRCDQDHNSLQSDLDLLVKWTQLWQMSLNISKCVNLTCSRRPPLFSSSYLIFNLPLKQVTEHPYLGVVIDSKMSFSPYWPHNF